MADAYEIVLHQEMNRCVAWAYWFELDELEARYLGGAFFELSPAEILRYRMEQAGCA